MQHPWLALDYDGAHAGQHSEQATLPYLHRSTMLAGTSRCECMLVDTENYPIPKSFAATLHKLVKQCACIGRKQGVAMVLDSATQLLSPILNAPALRRWHPAPIMDQKRFCASNTSPGVDAVPYEFFCVKQNPSSGPTFNVCQAGFGWGSDHHTYAFLEQLHMRKDTRTYCAFMDVRKAFDVAWRDGAMLCLHRTGVQGGLWHLLDNEISSRTLPCRFLQLRRPALAKARF